MQSRFVYRFDLGSIAMKFTLDKYRTLHFVRNDARRVTARRSLPKQSPRHFWKTASSHRMLNAR
jgi:hypothetical protein